jgi:hypothetical protein
VQVSISAREEDPSSEAKETLNVPGASKAFVNGRKEITLVFARTLAPSKQSGGLGTGPRSVSAVVTGDREPAELIAKLLGASSLGKSANARC